MFRLSRWSIAGCVLLGALAASVYPGGTALDPCTSGYSFSQNFISDLGMTVAHGGQSNPLGAALAGASFMLLACSIVGCAVGFIRVHGSSPRARPFAQAGGAGAMLAGACLLAAAFAPENLVPAVHVWAARSATLIALPSLVLLAVASARDGRFAASILVAWTVLALTVAVWFAMRWAPEATTPIGLTVQASLQKGVAVLIVEVVTYQAYRGEAVAKSQGVPSEL